MSNFSPREIVSELDRYIIGQNAAKRAVAIALRNRWRRQQLEGQMKEEVLPKNILMIGPTGVGKTEISRRPGKARRPHRSSRSRQRNLPKSGMSAAMSKVSFAIWSKSASGLVRDRKREEVRAKAEQAAEERVLDALVGEGAQPSTRDSFRHKLRANELNDREIEIQVADSGGMPMFEIPGQPGSSMGMINLNDMLGKALGGRTKTKRVTRRRQLPDAACRRERQAAR